MDLTAPYCPLRRDLEERSWLLVSKLAELTAGLMRLVGKNRPAFAAAKKQCTTVRDSIDESRQRLLDHRLAHGC